MASPPTVTATALACAAVSDAEVVRRLASASSRAWCSHYMIQPLVELYGGFMVVLKVS
jgi:hypothetical protein